MKKRVLSLFMALMLCLTLLPTAALAAEPGAADGTSAVETAGADAEAAAKAEAEAKAKAEAEAKAKADAEAVAAVQAQIDALPDAAELDGMDDEDAMAVYEAFQTACDAYYETLTEEQQAQLKNTEKLAALSDWFSQPETLAESGYIYPDTVDAAEGNIIRHTSWRRNGPIYEGGDGDADFTDGQSYVVQGSNVTIHGNLTVGGIGTLILCEGAKLTVEGALICNGDYSIYGQSDKGNNAGRLVIENSKGGGAAIRLADDATGTPTLHIDSGEVTINGGSSKTLIDGVKLSSTNHIHQGTLDGTAVSPAEWGETLLKGGMLTLAYCTHYNATYVSVNQTQHTKNCPDCGFVGTAVACGTNGSEGSVSVGDGGHRQKCPCGNTFGDVIPHTVETVPTHSKEHHVSGCQYCDYTSGSPETHEWDSTTGECTKCHFKPIAQGTWLSIHDSLQEAMDEASEITGAKALVTLYSEASGNTAIDDEFEFNYPGKTITLDMAGHSLEHQGNPIITVEAGTLIVKGTATITKKADSPEQVNSAIVVKGGELIFEDTLNVTGSAQNLSAAPAILVKGGTVTFEKDVTATAVENAGIDTVVASAIKATGGKLIFNGMLTAKGGLGGVPKNTRPCEPAVYAEGGELEFNGDLDLNGGLTITGSAELTKGLTQGAFKVDYGSQTVNGKQLSVKDSSVYKKVSDLLAEGYACVKTDSLAEGKEKEYVNTGANICSFDVTIEEHTHKWTPAGSSHDCVCGASDGHKEWENGKCGVCGYACLHESVNNDGTCFACGEKMTVEIVAKDGTTTYGTDFKAAMNAAENGTTVKLLADIKWGVTPQSRAEITGNGKIVTLNLNGHTITGGWIDIGDNNNPTSCTLKIIGEGGHESLEGIGGYSGVSPKATLDLSEWEGGTISAINISDDSRYGAATREAAVIVGPKAGTIGKLTFGNNQLGELKKTKLSGGSFNEIWAANHQPVKLGDLLVSGYALQYENGSYEQYTKTLQNGSIYNVKVVTCPHAKINEDGHCAYCNATDFVAQVTAADGSSSAYTDIAAAIAAADGGTVKLLANAGEITISSPLKLDLNGKTAARLTVTGDVTLASLLPEGYAFKSDTTWISDLSGTELTNVSMAKIPIKSMDYPTEMSMTYGGAGTLLVKVEKGPDTGAVSFQWYKVEGGKETAVGSATMKNQFDLSAQKLPAGQHTFRFSATCDGYKKMSQDIAVTVQKANISASLITPPIAQENLTYTGQEQALITAGMTDYGTMQYSLTENGTYSQDIPTGTDAGAYTVWYRVIGDANHNDTAPASVAVRIGQKPLTITGVTAASKPYDGTTNADISSVTFDNVTLTRDTDYTVTASFDDAGVGSGKNVTATVTLMGQAAKNYALEQSSFPTTGSIIKANGGSLKTVELEQKYTDASDHTYTPDWLGLPGGQTWSYSSEYSVNNGSKATLTKQDIAAANGKLTYAISGGKAGDKITITLKASCNNYEDFTIILTITLTEKDNQQALRITGGTTVVYGQTLQLGTSGGSGSGAVTYTVTNGTGEATIDSDGVLTPVRIGSVTVTATKAGDSEYNAVTSSPVEITITRATPTGEPAYTKITASGKTLADAALGIGTITPAGGTIAWDDPTTTEVVANKSYGWTYTPTDTNYTTRTGTIKLWSKSSGGGSGRTAAVVAPDMPMLYRGGTGDAVKTLQEKLNAKGFDSGNVDGIFGAKTYAAVTAFQKANSLGVDGIVGKLTWAKLYDATPVNVTSVTTQPMLRTGSRGDAVRKLQEMLNARGYTCGNVDGIFGSKTYAAVLAFQKANDLGADGIVGPLTWGKLV